MADLMTAAYEYDKLQKKYKNFMVPAVKIKIGGIEVTAMKEIHIVSVETVLSLKSAGSVQVTFGECYDYKNGTFEKKLKSLAVLGKKVEVSFGYGSSLTTIFIGFLAFTEMTLDSEEGIYFRITALDVRRLMMTDNFHIKEHSIKNYSDAVKEIMKRYKKLCNLKIDATNENLEDGLIRQNSSDYDFIVRDLIESGRTEREFFVVGETAYFRKPKSVSIPIVTLGIGKGLIRFSRQAEYENQKIQVTGFDTASGKTVTGTAVSKAEDDLMDALGSPGERIVTAPFCTDSGKAEKQAKALASLSMAKRQRAEGSCVGLPEIVPGRFIRLERVDSLMNQKYYVTCVMHTYDEEGFVTSFETEGWK